MLRALLVAAALAPAFAAACDVPPGYVRVESKVVIVAYRVDPAPLTLGRHFAVDSIVCAVGAGFAPTGLRVDAQMPEHRHGMNYRAKVTNLGGGKFRAEGLLFHMPGRWQFVFDVEGKGRTERLTHDVMLD
jgi:hypothetical protein